MDRWLKEFIDSLRQALEAMTGESPLVQVAEPAPGAVDEEVLWWEQSFTLGPEAAIWTGTPEPAWSALGMRALKAAGLEESEPEDRKGTWLEILQQAMSSLARTMTEVFGREVGMAGGRESPQPPAHPARAVQIGLPGEPGVTIQVSFSPAFDLPAESPLPIATAGPAPEPDAPSPGVAPGAPPPRTIDLLLDVELPVSVSFGRAHLPLKDVLKLTSGSIVELNRGIAEAVEIIVNNCVIARGEVVVVEGNYGVRIQQIISRQERLRTLH